MFNIIKSVITNKNFELKDMLKKIDTQWISGKVTDEERDELISLAQNRANASDSIDLLEKISELEKRVTELEKLIAEKDSSDESEDETETPAYAEYQSGKWYYNGDVVMFENFAYKCTAPEGQVCVWSPTDFPPYWEILA